MPEARDAFVLTPDALNDVQLTLGGQVFGGWTRVSIERGIEQISGAFELGLTERWSGQDLPREIRPGQACSLAIGGEIQITGHLDDVAVSYDQRSHSLTVRGRDATGDLVDCAHLGPFEYKGLDLAQIASALAAPFEISVRVAGVDVGRPFPRFSVQPGETAFEAIERGARQRGVLPVSDGRGGLLLTKAGTAAMAGALRLGGRDGNIAAARGVFSHRDRFSVYVAKGQEGTESLSTWSNETAETVASPEARASDAGVGRYRPTIILAETQSDGPSLQDRADFARRVAEGRAQRATYTVPGWRTRGGEGEIWHPNRRVTVQDSFTGLARSMLIVSVVQSLTEDEGRLSRLVIVDPAAFDLLAEPEPEPDGSTSSLWGAA